MVGPLCRGAYDIKVEGLSPTRRFRENKAGGEKSQTRWGFQAVGTRLKAWRCDAAAVLRVLRTWLKHLAQSAQWLKTKLPEVSSGQEVEHRRCLNGEHGVYFTDDSPTEFLGLAFILVNGEKWWVISIYLNIHPYAWSAKEWRICFKYFRLSLLLFTKAICTIKRKFADLRENSCAWY